MTSQNGTKERPILFSGPMVRAILEGRKSQTRRVVKPQPVGEPGDLSEWSRGIARACGDYVPDPVKLAEHTERLRGRIFPFVRPGLPMMSPRCPYGAPGDRLWVRETWAHYHTVNHIRRSDGRAFDEVSDGLAGYRADGFDTIEDFRNHIRLVSEMDLEAVVIDGDRWQPSIHMPRWASRLTLVIKSVRVERLQEISEEDARAEGVKASDATMMFQEIGEGRVRSVPELQNTARGAYAVLWDSINAKRGYGWDANPWVWVIEFERVD